MSVEAIISLVPFVTFAAGWIMGRAAAESADADGARAARALRFEAESLAGSLEAMTDRAQGLEDQIVLEVVAKGEALEEIQRLRYGVADVIIDAGSNPAAQWALRVLLDGEGLSDE